MPKIKKNKAREKRIDMEIVVDAYDEAERAMGWFYYLEDKLQFPFKAQVIAKRLTSPLAKEETIQVEGLAPADECEHEMFVMVRWAKDSLGVPLSQLEVIDGDEQTQQAVEDWHYWVNRGYRFG